MDDITSILSLKKKEIKQTIRSGGKIFIETKNNPKGKYGGYSHYFWNLAHGRYKFNYNDKEQGFGGPRTLKFLVKYISVTDRILSHKRPIRILDIGCSSGFLRKFLESNVFKPEDIYYYGIDIRKSVLKKAVLDKLDIESGAEGDNIKSLYINWDVRNGLPFKRNSLDFVISFEMTKYLSKKYVKKLFGEISSVLKNEGLFVYSASGICDSTNQLKVASRQWRKRMSSFWEIGELKNFLKSNGLFVEKVYNAEGEYALIKRKLKKSHKDIFVEMNTLFPYEITQAVLGPFYPGSSTTKLLFVRKGAPDFLQEIKNMFPKEKIRKQSGYGNSIIFGVGKNKVVKYIPKIWWEKFTKVYEVIHEQTEIKLPKIISITESAISDNYIIVMEKTGETLIDKWTSLGAFRKERCLDQIVDISNQIHSIRFNIQNIGTIFSPGDNFDIHNDWRTNINNLCRYKLNNLKKIGLIDISFYNRLLSILDLNIKFIPQKVDYVLLSRDMSPENLTIDKNSNITLLLDFETFIIGDKDLDTVITSTFIPEAKYKSYFLRKSSTSKDIEGKTKIYRLFLFLFYMQPPPFITSVKPLSNKKIKVDIVRSIEKGDIFFPYFRFKNR